MRNSLEPDTSRKARRGVTTARPQSGFLEIDLQLGVENSVGRTRAKVKIPSPALVRHSFTSEAHPVIVCRLIGSWDLDSIQNVPRLDKYIGIRLG